MGEVMKIGINVSSKVFYKGEEYEVVWMYDNENCEILNFSKSHIVNVSDLQKVG
jgi:hypothetical protein